jgi:hypothetical protein
MFKLDLHEWLLEQNLYPSCQWISTLAIIRSLAQRKSTVPATVFTITTHLPFFFSSERYYHACWPQENSSCYPMIRKLFPELLALVLHWVFYKSNSKNKCPVYCQSPIGTLFQIQSKFSWVHLSNPRSVD